jgi:hypothetical protein
MSYGDVIEMLLDSKLNKDEEENRRSKIEVVTDKNECKIYETRKVLASYWSSRICDLKGVE